MDDFTKTEMYASLRSQLKALQHTNDTEVAHYAADNILIVLLVSLGYAEIAELWSAIDKWYA